MENFKKIRGKNFKSFKWKTKRRKKEMVVNILLNIS